MIKKFPLKYTPKNENRRIHLYLPDDYNESDEHYPVIYMFDGHNLFNDEDATYGKSWGLRSYLDNWEKKVIVVGMECSHRGNARLAEYCPYKFHSAMFGGINGMGDRTMQWIIDKVKPYIDSHYRTMPFRETTAIAGSSMGGIMSLYAVVKYNMWFSKAACLSPAVGYCMPSFRKEIRSSEINPDTRIYMSWGTEEWPEYARPMTRNIHQLDEMLQEKGASTWLLNQQGGRHCEEDWEKQTSTWMPFLWF